MGGAREGSSLHTRNGELLLRAAPGGDSDVWHGGAGYSGGGGGGSGQFSGDGGRDGRDGCCGDERGSGSYFHLDSIPLTTVNISAGLKGEEHTDSYLGGGGGGVLLGGAGPQEKPWDGEGYGGGQGGCCKFGDENPGSPGTGLVILEIIH